MVNLLSGILTHCSNEKRIPQWYLHFSSSRDSNNRNSSTNTVKPEFDLTRHDCLQSCIGKEELKDTGHIRKGKLYVRKDQQDIVYSVEELKPILSLDFEKEEGLLKHNDDMFQNATIKGDSSDGTIINSSASAGRERFLRNNSIKSSRGGNR
ncbi:hypothetical protein HHI36_007689 [Cryptolaemus montrouzieri]|uniref:Uncharacterized protein n=1 Tax=Cryptolaemus montrouzieri TaxID=559131 RepID=A0ABD2MQ97_9CUCU